MRRGLIATAALLGSLTGLFVGLGTSPSASASVSVGLLRDLSCRSSEWGRQGPQSETAPVRSCVTLWHEWGGVATEESGRFGTDQAYSSCAAKVGWPCPRPVST